MILIVLGSMVFDICERHAPDSLRQISRYRKLLKIVLDVQYEGDKAAADRFIDQYTTWRDDVHGVIAKNIRDAQRYRFRVFKYAALGE